MIVPETEAQRELEPGETVLWADRPDPSKQGLTYLPILIFAIPWTVFSVYMMWQSATQFNTHGPSGGMQVFPVLFMIPFVLIGFGMLSTPYWMARKAQSTVYAVTNRRILVINAGNSRSVRSVHPVDIGELQRTERPDGSGTLIFGKPSYNSNNTQTASVNDRFIGIRNVRMVEQLIRDNLKNAPPPNQFQSPPPIVRQFDIDRP